MQQKVMMMGICGREGCFFMIVRKRERGHRTKGTFLGEVPRNPDLESKLLYKLLEI